MQSRPPFPVRLPRAAATGRWLRRSVLGALAAAIATLAVGCAGTGLRTTRDRSSVTPGAAEPASATPPPAPPIAGTANPADTPATDSSFHTIAGPDPRPGDPLVRRGDEMSVCGQLFHTGTRVVLWNDVGGYDAYRPHRHLDETRATPRDRNQPDATARFGTFRRNLPPAVEARVRAHGWDLEDLRQVVHQVVIHYDACGTSRRCFEVLHDIRGLSCHFLLDVDGTIYQTLDVKERAWHASSANDRSVGIEIAHIGAEPTSAAPRFSEWYDSDARGPRLSLPANVRTGWPPDLELRPARPELIRGPIHGYELAQYDFTREQYDALVKLLASLSRVLPGIRAEVPRGADGKVPSGVLSARDQTEFQGFLGHYHLTTEKHDPGPAFDWEQVLTGVRAVLAR